MNRTMLKTSLLSLAVYLHPDMIANLGRTVVLLGVLTWVTAWQRALVSFVSWQA